MGLGRAHFNQFSARLPDFAAKLFGGAHVLFSYLMTYQYSMLES